MYLEKVLVTLHTVSIIVAGLNLDYLIVGNNNVTNESQNNFFNHV